MSDENSHFDFGCGIFVQIGMVESQIPSINVMYILFSLTRLGCGAKIRKKINAAQKEYLIKYSRIPIKK